jgi:hypothetical protein
MDHGHLFSGKAHHPIERSGRDVGSDPGDLGHDPIFRKGSDPPRVLPIFPEAMETEALFNAVVWYNKYFEKLYVTHNRPVPVLSVEDHPYQFPAQVFTVRPNPVDVSGEDVPIFDACIVGLPLVPALGSSFRRLFPVCETFVPIAWYPYL